MLITRSTLWNTRQQHGILIHRGTQRRSSKSNAAQPASSPGTMIGQAASPTWSMHWTGHLSRTDACAVVSIWCTRSGLAWWISHGSIILLRYQHAPEATHHDLPSLIPASQPIAIPSSPAPLEFGTHFRWIQLNTSPSMLSRLSCWGTATGSSYFLIQFLLAHLYIFAHDFGYMHRLAPTHTHNAVRLSSLLWVCTSMG